MKNPLRCLKNFSLRRKKLKIAKPKHKVCVSGTFSNQHAIHKAVRIYFEKERMEEIGRYNTKNKKTKNMKNTKRSLLTA